jgi:hypothetical protein
VIRDAAGDAPIDLARRTRTPRRDLPLRVRHAPRPYKTVDPGHPDGKDGFPRSLQRTSERPPRRRGTLSPSARLRSDQRSPGNAQPAGLGHDFGDGVGVHAPLSSGLPSRRPMYVHHLAVQAGATNHMRFELGPNDQRVDTGAVAAGSSAVSRAARRPSGLRGHTRLRLGFTSDVAVHRVASRPPSAWAGGPWYRLPGAPFPRRCAQAASTRTQQ